MRENNFFPEMLFECGLTKINKDNAAQAVESNTYFNCRLNAIGNPYDIPFATET